MSGRDSTCGSRCVWKFGRIRPGIFRHASGTPAMEDGRSLFKWGRETSERQDFLATISVRNTCSIFPDDEEICGCQAGFREFDRNFGRTIMIIGERKRLEGTSLVHVIF